MKHLVLFIVAYFFIPSSLAAFPDVSPLNIHYSAIMWAQQQGIVGGYPDGTYRPDTAINRAEFLKIVLGSRIDGNPITGENCFPDVQNQWFAPYVCSGKSRGVVNGYPNGLFQPAQLVTYVESAKILTKTHNLPTTSVPNAPWYAPYLYAIQTVNATLNVPLNHHVTRGEMAYMVSQALGGDSQALPKKSDYGPGDHVTAH